VPSLTIDVRSLHAAAPQRALFELATGLSRLPPPERERVITQLGPVGPVEQLARFRRLHPALVSRPV
jgi:hypothetical protein